MSPKFQVGEYVKLKNNKVECYCIQHTVYGETYFSRIFNIDIYLEQELLIKYLDSISPNDEPYNRINVYICESPNRHTLYVPVSGVEFVY